MSEVVSGGQWGRAGCERGSHPLAGGSMQEGAEPASLLGFAKGGLSRAALTASAGPLSHSHVTVLVPRPPFAV